MTPTERAEKIAVHFNESSTSSWIDPDAVAFIAAQIAEAEREADKKIVEAYQTGLQRGWTAAREKAAGIVETLDFQSEIKTVNNPEPGHCGGYCPHGVYVDEHVCRKCIANQIRKMEPGG